MITNEEISELEAKINGKVQEGRIIEDVRRTQLKSLQFLKFTDRLVEDQPAEYIDAVDPDDPTKIIRVLVNPATMKRVYDVPPKSRDDPTEDLEDSVKIKRFDEINALY